MHLDWTKHADFKTVFTFFTSDPEAQMPQGGGDPAGGSGLNRSGDRTGPHIFAS